LANDLKKLFGHGFLASVAGIEITNIIVFTKLGAVYGVPGFVLTMIFLLPVAYLQQLIVLPRKLYGYSLIDDMRATSQFSYKVYLYTIYVASILTFMVNIIGLSVILSIVIGSKWIYYGLLIIALIWILDTVWKSKGVEKIFLILSMVLMIYIVLFFIELPVMGSVNILELDKPISCIDLLALWGAAAAPYSLIIQDLGDEDYASIYIGTMSSMFIGLSISFVAYTIIYPVDEFSIIHTLEPFYNMGSLIVPVYTLGLFSSIVLALMSIILTLRIIYRKLYLRTIFLANNFIEYLLLAIMVSTVPLAILFGVDDILLYTELIIYGSMVIGFLFSLTVLALFIYYLRKSLRNKESILIFNTVFLGILTIVSLLLSIDAFIESIYGL